MDEARARRMTDELLGKSINGWHLISFAGAGKSALVFRATRGVETAAVKVFDPELVERFGKQVQLARIDRECRLIGSNHPHLIRILEGGECLSPPCLYVAMEYLDWANLGDLRKVVPRLRIWPLIAQVAEAAKYLESKDLAHRDIKPENIAVDHDFQNAKLLDLGVLRPFGDPSLTDDQARVFVGTLRYSSPEFLLRKELDTDIGWRAITFYQLGAVIHDMIVGEPLFSEYSDPFAALVEAVKSRKPRFSATDVPADLVVLASNCLVKSPTIRLELVNWDSFKVPSGSPSSSLGAKERVRQRRAQSALSPDEHLSHAQLLRQEKRLLKDVRDLLDAIIRLECISNDLFPRCKISEHRCPTGETGVQVLFENSVEHNLSSVLGCCFKSKILDLDASAVSITCAAKVLGATTSTCDWQPADFSMLYSGVFEESLIKSRISDTLYIALDSAQTFSPEEIAGNQNNTFAIKLSLGDEDHE